MLKQLTSRLSARRSVARRRSPGQALVEFALTATLIFFLLAAAVDLGLIFFTLQAMRTAAQEGATYGSYPVQIVDGSGSVTAVDLNYPEIINRVRLSGGNPPRGFVNLLDLNNNGTDDSQEGLTSTAASQNPDNWIVIQNLKGANPQSLTSTCDTTTPRVDMRNAARNCYIRVTVRYNYRFIFPLAPAFGDTVRLQTSFLIKVRSSFVG